MLLLGNRVRDDLVLPLTAGAAYLCTLAAPEPWPAGTQVELRFPNTTVDPWRADIDGADAVFRVAPGDVDDVLAARPRTVQLWYLPDDDTPMLWARGRIDPT